MRFLTQILVVLAAGLAGFLTGGMLASTFLISPGAGLAGAAEAVLYAAAGAVLFTVVAGFTVRRLQRNVLIATLLALLTLLAILIALVLGSNRPDGSPVSPVQEPRGTTTPAAGDTR